MFHRVKKCDFIRLILKYMTKMANFPIKNYHWEGILYCIIAMHIPNSCTNTRTYFCIKSEYWLDICYYFFLVADIWMRLCVRARAWIILWGGFRWWWYQIIHVLASVWVIYEIISRFNFCTNRKFLPKSCTQCVTGTILWFMHSKRHTSHFLYNILFR